MSSELENVLLQHRSRLLSRLIELAISYMSASTAPAFRVEADRIVKEITAADRALTSASDSELDLRYAACDRAIDAVLMYLDEVKTPAKLDLIVRSVIEGGYKRGKERLRDVIVKSIQNHLTGTGSKSLAIKEINGLIGRYDWPDSSFGPLL